LLSLTYWKFSYSFDTSKSWESFSSVAKDSTSNDILQKVSLKIDNVDDLDGQIEDYLTERYSIISNNAIAKIQSTKYVDKKLVNDTLGIVEFYLTFDVPKYYLEDKPLLLWELNIAAFHSRLFQIYNKDTIFIDTWPNVVGKPSTKTYTGHYSAFRLRNWPFWKDPESPDSVRPTPPGPNNPLGLFVVHYDENSLRYFHGTNKNYLLKNEMRALSHGCVRNLNENIAKMKEFIIKRVIKNDDLSGWLGSKKSMTFEIKEPDRFPVRIIYKTFDIDYDEYGYYIVFYKDVYNYEKNLKLSEYDDPDLITLTNEGNVLGEFRDKHLPTKYSNEKIIPILQSLVNDHKYYEKYYFDDLLIADQPKN
jgi:hypothetical protein